MSARDIIIRPIITEKSMRQNSEDNKITFEVAKDANKTAVAQALQEIYNIKPEKVNIVNVRPKTKRMGRYVLSDNHTGAAACLPQSDKLGS